MKAVSNLRSRMRLADSSLGDSPEPPMSGHPLAAGHPLARRRACTSTTTTTTTAASPNTNDDGHQSPLRQRAWAVGARKLRGLHPAPVVVYVRENAAAVAATMDKLYATLTTVYAIDSRDIRVADVPTAFDLPGAVRRMAKDKQLVVVVALLARDAPWFDEPQVARVRDYLLTWSQACGVPLVDGVLIGDDAAQLARRVAAPVWAVAASDDVAAAGLAAADRRACTDAEDAALMGLRIPPHDEPASSHPEAASAGCVVFGQYLAHRAVEMFYIEHRGW
ncbi:hypothetical protein GGI04_002600 [Coemansia thaxteri]|uniref:6,7-dimethyl-8-ribityllumazine synthase n=1 Tax=Coemansia thaxteri TaxID=2663907 RepID=A0A9W8EHM0_9FUNG|nr:hypothetical protein H4R26_003448 [Coemansia thaxteri]KAJ2004469.1 hypothetical protein GGI04_002600 [Coemansia thaxteri]KAJ2472533.1 hypothetical protein GGI02_001522 [Coemansia sp. RSA 2322]KAJ2474785.1 hypothetical protein EV174_005508 [Coemansia sp. RSA 2320]